MRKTRKKLYLPTCKLYRPALETTTKCTFKFIPISAYDRNKKYKKQKYTSPPVNYIDLSLNTTNRTFKFIFWSPSFQ